MFGWFRKTLKNRQERGFTLIELVVVLAILGILIALAVPRYLAARKKAYKAEADNVIQESKTLEWAYYQQYNLFDTTGANIGLVTPGGMHWGPVSFGGTNNQFVSIMMTGCATCSPINATDSVSIVLYSDGASSGGASF